MGQTSETSGGVVMMRGRDEALRLLCMNVFVCVCVGSAGYFINLIKYVLCGHSVSPLYPHFIASDCRDNNT